MVMNIMVHSYNKTLCDNYKSLFPGIDNCMENFNNVKKAIKNYTYTNTHAYMIGNRNFKEEVAFPSIGCVAMGLRLWSRQSVGFFFLQNLFQRF